MAEARVSPGSGGGPCLLCGHPGRHTLCDGVRDFEYGAPGTYTWERCSGCGLVRLDPVPEPEVLALAYPPSYHAYQAPGAAITRWLRQRALAAVARAAVRGLPRGAAILDLGCASGDLLEAIGRAGEFRLHGVELDARMAEAARQKGIAVWEGMAEDVPLPDSGFDLVIMQHVLEHVIDPLQTLRAVHRALKPGGRVIGELPNLRSWDACLFGRYWGGGHAPRHITHFTPATLALALREAGFSGPRTSAALHTGHAALSVQNWLRRKHPDTRGLAFGRAAYYPLLLVAAVPLNAIACLVSRTGVMRFEACKA